MEITGGRHHRRSYVLRRPDADGESRRAHGRGRERRGGSLSALHIGRSRSANFVRAALDGFRAGHPARAAGPARRPRRAPAKAASARTSREAASPLARPLAPAEVDRLADEIADVASHIDAAEHRLLTLIRRFDEGAGWGLMSIGV
jgi:hypothetical protein